MTIVLGGFLSEMLLMLPFTRTLDINPYAYCITYDVQLPKEDTCKVLSDNKGILQLMKIDELIGTINDKNHSLKTLLKEKNKILDKLQTILDFFAHTKTPFNELQMKSFTRFTGAYSQDSGALQNTLRKIDTDKELMAARKELLRREANYNTIITELTSFSNSLSDAIGYLRGIVELGNSTLQLL